MAGNSLHDPEYYSSSEVVLAESRAAGRIRQENSRFSALNIREIRCRRSHHMQRQSCHIRVIDWMQRNRRHIIYDADFVPAIHLPLCYNVQDSALFADDLRNPFSC
jgi:hypothetical protein